MNDDGGRNSTTIEDLDDNMLTQILFRLPSCESIVACKPLNKRWCSLISDPKFGSQFSNYKKESSALLKPGSSDIDDDKPPWTFIAMTCNKGVVFGSPKLSMEFLPCAFVIEATFMDLVLCSGPTTSPEGDQIYYLTNPLTKQWVALPPRPAFRVRVWKRTVFPVRVWKPWVGLVCQQPYDDDYKFRVVVIKQCPPPVYELLVYCSEICEWKKFNLTVSINPELDPYEKGRDDYIFQGVVCNGIIYLHQRIYFAAFNPFDVDETTDTTTIEATILPSLPDPVGSRFLRESSGQLYIMHNPNKGYPLWYREHGTTIEFPLKVWKLDPNQVPLIWKKTFEGLCTGNVNNVKPPPRISGLTSISVLNLGVHPNNDKLIYMHFWEEDQFVLCDTRTRLIKPLKTLSGYNIMTLNRLEFQWWPTSVPKAYLSNAFHDVKLALGQISSQ